MARFISGGIVGVVAVGSFSFALTHWPYVTSAVTSVAIVFIVGGVVATVLGNG